MLPTGERLRLLREHAGLKQSDVAQRLNIAPSTYSGLENGSNINLDRLVALAKFYNTSTDYLLGLSNEVNPLGDKLSSLFASLAKRGCNAVSGTDTAELAETLIRYLRAGAPCGDIPLEAWHDFMQELQASLEAAIKGDCAALVDGTNAAAIAALNVTKMPAAFYEKKGGITHE